MDIVLLGVAVFMLFLGYFCIRLGIDAVQEDRRLRRGEDDY